jgi:RNA polymerase sigma-70 factor (ECF subfamily)
VSANRQALLAWVGGRILPHEADLRVWLRRAFPRVETDDVVQEAYCRIATLPSWDHIDDPRRYLFRTARNIVLEQVRRERVVSIEAASGLSVMDQADAEFAPTPEAIAGDRRMLARVEALISSLPERAGRIFRLRKIEGLSQRDISQALGVSEMIVENEVARGLRRILDQLTAEERAELPLRKARLRKQEQRDIGHD